MVGSCSVFFAANNEMLETLIGREVLRAIVGEVGALERKRSVLDSYTSQPLPPASEISKSINGKPDHLYLKAMSNQAFILDFLMELNREIRLFSEQELRDELHDRLKMNLDPNPGWSMTCSIILAHCVRNQSCCRDVSAYKGYLKAAMEHLPRLAVSRPTSLEVSSLMAMVPVL